MRDYSFLRTLNLDQLLRLYNRIYYRMIAGDGYQSYGYDWPTIRAAYPSFYRDLRAVADAIGGVR